MNVSLNDCDSCGFKTFQASISAISRGERQELEGAVRRISTLTSVGSRLGVPFLQLGRPRQERSSLPFLYGRCSQPPVSASCAVWVFSEALAPWALLRSPAH